jgi:hypothetical protein
MVLYHVDDEVVTFNNGAVHVILPPETPVEVFPEYDALVLLQEKAFHGVVRVNEVRTARGVSFDVEDAHIRAAEALAAADQNTINQFVEGQFEDRVKTGRPPLPPAKNSRLERLVKKYHVDFKASYGLDVVSIATAQAKLEAQRSNSALVERQVDLEKSNQELREQNTALAASMIEMGKKLDALLKK